MMATKLEATAHAQTMAKKLEATAHVQNMAKNLEVGKGFPYKKSTNFDKRWQLNKKWYY